MLTTTTTTYNCYNCYNYLPLLIVTVVSSCNSCNHLPMLARGVTVADLTGIDLLALVERDTRLKRAASTNGGEWKGACPFCGGRDRFCVWPNDFKGARWWCRQCERGGDAIAYQVEHGDLTPQEAGRLRHGDQALQEGQGRLNRAQPRRSRAKPTPEARREADKPIWDASAALAVVADCEAALWTVAGEKARAWLHERGLTDDTLRAWRSGYNPTARKVRDLWTPRGIVMPCFVGDVLWYVKVRRPAPPLPGPKYQKLKGSKSALYGLPFLTGKRAVVICEGELDAVLLWQEAGDLVDVVAVGSASGRPAMPFLVRLAGATRWLVALDRDAAGETGADWWGEYSARVRRVRPLQGNDLTDFHQAGGDLHAWVAYHLEQLVSDKILAKRPKPVQLIETLPPTPAGLERALALLESATGCPDAEADRLLAHWDELNVRCNHEVEVLGEVTR